MGALDSLIFDSLPQVYICLSIQLLDISYQQPQITFFVLGRPYVRIPVTSHATIHLQMACAPEPTSHYTEDSLHLAIQDVLVVNYP